MTEEKWYSSGLEFSCKSCAGCCKTHGEYAYIYVNEKDISAIAKFLGLGGAEFFERYCLEFDGLIHFREDEGDCHFLEGNRCRIYPVRPKQCETWPFWTSNLFRQTWEGPVAECCPGVAHGRHYTQEEIERIARERDDWYKKVGRP